MRWLVIGLALLCQLPAYSQQARTWKDTTGQFSIDAALTSHDAKSVNLKTSDGRVIEVSKSRLSRADLAYLESLPAPDAKPSAMAAEQKLTAAIQGPPVAGKAREPLADFLSRIGVPFFVDQRGLDEIGLSTDLAMNTDQNATSLAEQLDASLESLDLTWYRLRSVLVITTKEVAEDEAIETLVYRIPTPRNDLSAVMQRLQAIEPDSWEALGGPGSVTGMPGVFLIRQSPAVHRQLIQKLKVRPLPHRYVHPLDNLVVSLEVLRNDWDALAKQLSDQLKRPVTATVSVKEGYPSPLSLTNVTAGDALAILANHAGVDWLEKPSGLELVSSKHAEQQQQQQRVTIPFASPQTAGLITNMIMTVVTPDAWAPLGGPGNIQHVGGKSFLVFQSQPRFRELAQLMADIGSIR
ncbi:SHD1 domain-containing protein [Roseimaritima ulvae]|nr:SHD1 domain-containing protein [Roseimaritima ulvae]